MRPHQKRADPGGVGVAFLLVFQKSYAAPSLALTSISSSSVPHSERCFCCCCCCSTARVSRGAGNDAVLRIRCWRPHRETIRKKGAEKEIRRKKRREHLRTRGQKARPPYLRTNGHASTMFGWLFGSRRQSSRVHT